MILICLLVIMIMLYLIDIYYIDIYYQIRNYKQKLSLMVELGKTQSDINNFYKNIPIQMENSIRNTFEKLNKNNR